MYTGAQRRCLLSARSLKGIKYVYYLVFRKNHLQSFGFLYITYFNL
jgi:hypothetical protein